jgi:hypothetical protein
MASSPDESSAVVASISKNRLPENFWSLDAFNGKEHLKDLHAAVVDRLTLEAPDADTLELMLMERVCFLYIFMRAKEIEDESSETLQFDRTYKDMMTLWVSMATALRQQRLRAEEVASVRMAVVSEVSRALKEALKDLDPKIGFQIQSKIVSLVAV